MNRMGELWCLAQASDPVWYDEQEPVFTETEIDGAVAEANASARPGSLDRPCTNWTKVRLDEAMSQLANLYDLYS